MCSSSSLFARIKPHLLIALIAAMLLFAGSSGLMASTGQVGTYDVTVNITPASAVEQGAQWRIYTHTASGMPWILYTVGTDADGWRNDGETVTFPSAPYGYKIEFSPVTNWEGVADIIRDLPTSWPYTESGEYVPFKGSIKTSLEPQDAVAGGAKWRRKGTFTWQDNNYSEDWLEPGSYTVEFKPVDGYETPDDIDLHLSAGEIETPTGTYQSLGGDLKVIINPAEARQDGATWRRVGVYKWFDSGFTERDIPAGQYTVRFKTIAGWNKPGNIDIQITQGNTTELTVNYTPMTDGSVKVIIDPQEVVGDAKWGIGTTPNNHTPFSSGDEVQLAPGWYQVWFNSVNNKITPMDQEILVKANEQSVLEISYDDLIVGKMKIYGDNIVRSGSGYDVTGHAGFGFVTSTTTSDGTAAAADATAPATYSQKLFNVTGGLDVFPNNNSVSGSGEIKLKNDYGPWQPFINFFKLNVIYKGPFTIDAQNLKSTNTTDSEATSSFLGFDCRTLSFRFELNPFTLIQEVKLVFLPNIFPSETDEYIHIEKMVSQAGSSTPEIVGRAFMQGVVVVEDFFEFDDMELTFDTITNSFSGTGRILQPELGEFAGSFNVKDGKLKKIVVDVGGIGIPLPGIEADVLELDRLYFKLIDPSKDMMQITLDATFNILPIGDNWSLAEVIGKFYLDLQGFLAASIDFNVLGYDTATGTVQAFFKGSNQFFVASGNQNIFFGLIRGSAFLYNQWKPNKNYDNWMVASVGVDIPVEMQWLVGGADRISVGGVFLRIYKRGFEATINVLGLFDINFSLPPFWENDAEPGYSIGGQKRLYTSTSPATIETYTVPENCPSAIFGGSGEFAVPDFVLTDPAGNSYDPVLGFDSSREDVSYVSHDASLGAGFIVQNPTPGSWRLEVRNNDEAGNVNVRFIANNSRPSFVPGDVEDNGDGSYRFNYRAFDADDDAGITFFWCPTNEAFGGTEIGTGTEKDGKGHFDWTPGDDDLLQGYLLARISDGTNMPVNVFYEDRIFVGIERPARPKLSPAKVKNDRIVARAPVRGSEFDHYRVYYTDDMAMDAPEAFFNFPKQRRIVITPDLLKAGRKYKLWVSAVSANGVEGKLSRRRFVDYRAIHSNNEPQLLSAAPVDATVGVPYTYVVQAFDYDGDPMTYALENAPEGMTVDQATHTVTWTPGNEDIGPAFATLRVSDGRGGSDTQQLVIAVSGSNTLSSPMAISAQRVAGAGTSALVINLHDPVAGRNAKKVDHLKATIAHPETGERLIIDLVETSANSSQFQAIIDLRGPNSRAAHWLSTPSRMVTPEIIWKSANGTARKAPLAISGK